MGRTFLLATTIATLAVALACGGDDDGGDADGGGGSITALLGAIPDSEEAAQYVNYVDMAALRDEAGVDRLPSDASEDELTEWVGAIADAQGALRGPGFVSFISTAAQVGVGVQSEIGINATQIDRALEAGPPPELYTVLAGDFDSGEIEDAVRSDPVFSDILEDASYGGVDYYSWGEDFRQDFERGSQSELRRIGVGHRLALYEEMLFWCAWTAGVEGMIDAASGQTSSLADRDDYGPIARVFDEAGAYSATFTTQTLELASDSLPLLLPYSAQAAAGARDADDTYLIVAIANADEETATENATLLEQRITEAMAASGEHVWAAGIETAQTRAEGTLTIAELRGDDLPWDFVLRQDPAIAHGPS